MNPSFSPSLEGGDATREEQKQALKFVDSAQDNMDVRVEATKAALCFGLSSEWLFWQANIDQHCVCA